MKIIVTPEPYVYVQQIEKGNETISGMNDGWVKLHCSIVNDTGLGISYAVANLKANKYEAEISVRLNSPDFEMNQFYCHYPVNIELGK